MENKQQYFLVKEETDFYDPHGCPDSGGSTKFVSKDDFYNDLKPGILYTEDGDVFDDTKEYYGEDGYNCEVTTFKFSVITEEQFKEFGKIITDYEKL